jgi:hypothetical protein
MGPSSRWRQIGGEVEAGFAEVEAGVAPAEQWRQQAEAAGRAPWCWRSRAMEWVVGSAAG